MTEWQPIETAPKDGRPVWAKGLNYGDESKGIHCTWAWFDGENWRGSNSTDGQAYLSYLVSWMPLIGDSHDRTPD